MYLDDILIFMKTVKKHVQAVWRVLKVLVEHKLVLHLEKCKFQKTQIEYLELIISKNEISIDPVKVSGVHEWPIPESQTDVQAFLGFANFYQKFICDFFMIACLLFDLTKSKRPWT